MNRRTFFTTATLTALAGCTSSITGSSPQYETDNKEDLFLSVDAFPDGWQRDDEINDNFDRVFVNEDDTIVVLLSAGIHEEVDAAKTDFEESQSGFRDPQELDIGDEAFWDTRNDEAAFTIFRHSNALGQAASMRQSGMEVNPDQSRSQQYAQTMFDQWQG